MKIKYETNPAIDVASVSLIKYRDLGNTSHFHSEHELIYVISGEATVMVDGEVRCMPSKTAVFVSSGTAHYIQSDINSVIAVMKLNSERFKMVTSGINLISPFIIENYGIEDSFESIIAEQKQNDDFSALTIENIASQLLVRIFRGEATEKEASDIEKHMSRDKIYSFLYAKISAEYATLTFSTAAKYMHFSEPYFSKLFKDIFGMTFTKYINAVRISNAVEKIKSGKYTVTQAATSCGFNTIRSFNRTFKELTGHSPTSLPKNYTFGIDLCESAGFNPTESKTIILKA